MESRDARKQHRKERERIIGQQRRHDRLVKEDSLKEEEEVRNNSGSLAQAVPDAPTADLRRSITMLSAQLKLEEQRRGVTRKQRLLAFAMCRHRRLGADSAARILTRDVMTVIASFVPGVQVVVGCGWESILKPEGNHDLDGRFSSSLSQSVWLWDGRANWTFLPDLPEPCREAQFLYFAPRREVWCVGFCSPHGNASSEAWVLSLDTREWRMVPHVINPPRRGGVSVIYRNVLLTFGGFTSEDPPRDSCFVLSGSSPWGVGVLPLSHCSHHQRRSTAALIGDALMLWTSDFSWNGIGEESKTSECEVILLSEKRPSWSDFPPLENPYGSAPFVLDGKLFMAGAYIDTGCPTCSYSSERVRRLDLSGGKVEWTELLSSHLPSRTSSAAIVYTPQGVVLCGGVEHSPATAYEDLPSWQKDVYRLDAAAMKWRRIGLSRNEQVDKDDTVAECVAFPKKLVNCGVVQIGF